MIVNGFIEPIAKTLPMEYAVELTRLIELHMEGCGRLDPWLDERRARPPQRSTRRRSRASACGAAKPIGSGTLRRPGGGAPRRPAAQRTGGGVASRAPRRPASRRRTARRRGVPSELPDARLADRGVVFTDLATAAREHPELVRPPSGDGRRRRPRMPACGRSRSRAGRAAPSCTSLAGSRSTGRSSRASRNHAPMRHSCRTRLVVADEGKRASRCWRSSSRPMACAGWFGGTVAIHRLRWRPGPLREPATAR